MFELNSEDEWLGVDGVDDAQVYSVDPSYRAKVLTL